MKNLILTLTIAFILISCDDGNIDNSNTNPFVGAWEDTADTLVEQFIFTKDFEVTRTVRMFAPEDEHLNETNIGAYEYSDQIIYFYYNTPHTISVQAGYLLNGNNLTMSFGPNRTYAYKKIK